MLGFQPESGLLLGSIAPDFLPKKLEFLEFWMLLFSLKRYSNCTDNGTTASGSSFCCGLTELFLEYDNKGRFGTFVGISVRGSITGTMKNQKAMKC